MVFCSVPLDEGYTLKGVFLGFVVGTFGKMLDIAGVLCGHPGLYSQDRKTVFAGMTVSPEYVFGRDMYRWKICQ
jgi:hypothetical protein